MIEIYWQSYLQKSFGQYQITLEARLQYYKEREKTETFCDFFEVHPVEPQIKLSFPPPEFSPLNL